MGHSSPNNSISHPSEHKKKVSKVFKKPILGDIFGSFMSGNQSFVDSLMYRARLTENPADTGYTKEIKLEESSNIEASTSSFEAVESESDSDNELRQLKTMNPKQQLALTIKNWSVLPENDHDIINEGAVYALIALCYVEDSSIRRCCATSFYHLSSREVNREPLLNMGVTTGVVTLAMQARKWKVAKMCAMTLCNLSMQPNGEAIMAREGAILALVVLLGVKGQSLLPICVQALYNMTCTDEHFKGIERISKALLNISSSGFDLSDLLVKTLVNCSRYSWMRLRIIEDGAIGSLSALLPTLSSRENKKELVFHMLVVLRSLSDSSGCRSELLQKGAVDILNTLLPYCDEKGRLIILKVMHNFLRKPSAFSNAHFEIAVTMINHVALSTTSVVNLQYCAACMQIFTKEKTRGMNHLAAHIVDAMVLLLQSSDPTIQFYVITTCGDIFFNHLCNDPVKVEQLIQHFIQQGSLVNDPQNIQALALALAKVCQVDSYMLTMIRLQLLRVVFELLFDVIGVHSSNLLLQESCCIAICRIALRLEDVSNDDRVRIAKIFTVMLDLDDEFVLSSTISSIRVLCSSGLCHKHFLSAALLDRVASIVTKYKNKIELCRTGCAVLAVFSCDVDAHDLLAAEKIMNVLFFNIKAEDGFIKELVAITLCNISSNVNAGNVMSAMGVVEVLATLSNSTSEVILELCAKCICNLTCKTDLHPKMIKNKILDIILMIALVRSVANSTRIICAKALLNLITDDNLPTIRDSGAVRVFATLSALNNPPIQFVCAKGYYLLSLTQARREELVQRRAILQSLFNMVKCQSARIRVKVGITICNLLACPVTNKAAIKAGALSVAKILATMDFEELREATARVLINLALDASLHKSLLREPIVPILVLILHQSEGFTFECAIFALSCLSHHDAFKPMLIDKGLPAIISIILGGKLYSPNVANEACRTICNVSYMHREAYSMVASGHLILAMRAIYHGGICTTDSSILLVLAMRNMSELLAARQYLIEQNGFTLLVEIIRDFSANKFHCSIIYSAAITMIFNLALIPTLHEALLSQGLMEILQRICLQFERGRRQQQQQQQQLLQGSNPGFSNGGYDLGSFKLLRSTRKGSIVVHATQQAELSVKFTQREVDLISRTINLLSHSHSCHQMIVEGEVMRIFKSLIAGLSDLARGEMASALANISSSKECRESLVNQNSAELLIALSITSDSNTQAQCALALGYLSELTIVKNGIVASLLLLSLNLEEKIASANTDMLTAAEVGYVKTKPLSPSTKISTIPPINAGGVVGGGGPPDGAANNTAGSAASVGSNNVSNIASNTNTATNSSNANVNLTGSGVNSNSNRVTKTVSDEEMHGGKANNRLQTLSTMIRDLMVDKRKFDRFLEKLQRSNQLNLSSNSFVPRPDDNNNSGNNTAHNSNNAPPSVANTPTMRSKRNSSTSQSGRQPAASSSPFFTPPSSASQPQRGGGYVPSLEINGDLDNDDNSSVTTQNLGNDSYMEEGLADFAELDQEDASKINLNASNSRVIAEEEKAAVESDYKHFLYETVSDQGSARHSEPSGMQVRQLVDLPLPGIPTDRDLGGSTSQERLTSVPVNLESLPKECKPLNPAATTANTNSNANVHNPNTQPLASEATAAEMEGDDHPASIISSRRGVFQSQGSQGSGTGVGSSLEASIPSSRNTARNSSGATSPRQPNSASKFRRSIDKTMKGKKQ